MSPPHGTHKKVLEGARWLSRGTHNFDKWTDCWWATRGPNKTIKSGWEEMKNESAWIWLAGRVQGACRTCDTRNTELRTLTMIFFNFFAKRKGERCLQYKEPTKGNSRSGNLCQIIPSDHPCPCTGRKSILLIRTHEYSWKGHTWKCNIRRPRGNFKLMWF